MSEDFTEEDFEEDAEFATNAPPAPKKKEVSQRQQRQNPQRQPKNQPQDKFVAFAVPSRLGVFDNEQRQTFAESQDIQSLTLDLLVKVLNELDDIKSRL